MLSLMWEAEKSLHIGKCLFLALYCVLVYLFHLLMLYFSIFFRVILSACSPYFRAMFTGELAESRQTEVTIRDIDELAMELLIDFCYSSNIVVEEGNVQTLLPAGKYFYSNKSIIINLLG